MNATDIALVGLFLGFISGLCIVAYGVIQNKQQPELVDLPQSAINSISHGPVKISGTVVPKNENTFPGPVTSRDCVLSEYRVDRYDRKTDYWRRVDDGREFFSFYVYDGSGYVRVDPSNASLITSRANTQSTTVDKRGPTPEAVEELINRVSSLDHPSHQSSMFGSYDYNPKRQYIEDSIASGDTVYVFGTASPSPTDELADAVITETNEGQFFISDASQPTVDNGHSPRLPDSVLME